ncbi:MAG: apolipoprotein N-acyltransferase [Rikenellaceae bacterium]
MKVKSIYLSLISILLLSIGWLGLTGLTLVVALVPLLIISSRAERSRRGWWGIFGWSLFTFVGWNLSTIWWIGYATPVGPFAATLASTFLSMVAFMTYHTVAKYAPRSLSYTILVTLWVALEYLYTIGDFSWPWLLLGNGLSNDIWAVQWYEYTGIFGGSLWIMVSNILVFEFVRRGEYSLRAAIKPLAKIVLPLLISLIIFISYSVDEHRERMEISVIQPNVDAYEKFDGDSDAQERNIIDLLGQVPVSSAVALLPETALPRNYMKDRFTSAPYIRSLIDTLRGNLPNTTIISGINSYVFYRDGYQSATARKLHVSKGYVDYFNSAIAIDSSEGIQLRDKAKLVIGVENTPTWVFDLFKFFVIDIGGVVGQIGRGDSAEAFKIDDTRVGVAICYEALYGNFYSDFVRNGAEVMTIISNDGWWEDTPGHRHLYSFSSLRAIETRRAIARSANTGTSGFIDERGVSIESMGWEQRGVITNSLPLNNYMTLYVRYGDLIARLCSLLSILSLLYYIALRAKQRHNLV